MVGNRRVRVVVWRSSRVAPALVLFISRARVLRIGWAPKWKKKKEGARAEARETTRGKEPKSPTAQTHYATNKHMKGGNTK